MRTWRKGFSIPGKNRIALSLVMVIICSFVFMVRGVAGEEKGKAEKLVLTVD
jgi:hypothetical protein